MHRLLAVLLLSAISALSLTAQTPSATIAGRVVDVETLEPLPGVNVFLDQTLLGAATDSQGRFEIPLVPLGPYSVVASALGFETASMEVDAFVADTVYTVDLRMRTQVIGLGGVEVTGERSSEWRADYERFEQLFLGVTPRARTATIENPQTLSFSTEDGVFTARAHEPLRIRNDGLGYRVIFVLDVFQLDMRTGLLAANGPFFFEEMEPRNRRQARRWQRSRGDAYEGSLANVLAALVKDRLWAEPFKLFYDSRSNAPRGVGIGLPRAVHEHVAIRPAEQPHMHYVAFPNYLRMVHDQTESWIAIDGDEALVHASGYVYAPRFAANSVQVFGALAARGVADLLPRYYGWAP